MDKSKRNLAKILGVAGAGAAAWQKPIINAVSVPAHAVTTGCGISGITVSFEVANVGTSGDEYGASGSYSLWDDQGNVLQDDASVPLGPGTGGSVTDEYDNLPARTYYFSASVGGGGAQGTDLQGRVAVACCNGGAEDTDSSAGGFGLSLALVIEISDDGTCGATETTSGELPPFPI